MRADKNLIELCRVLKRPNQTRTRWAMVMPTMASAMFIVSLSHWATSLQYFVWTTKFSANLKNPAAGYVDRYSFALLILFSVNVRNLTHSEIETCIIRDTHHVPGGDE